MGFVGFLSWPVSQFVEAVGQSLFSDKITLVIIPMDCGIKIIDLLGKGRSS